MKYSPIALAKILFKYGVNSGVQNLLHVTSLLLVDEKKYCSIKKLNRNIQEMTEIQIIQNFMNVQKIKVVKHIFLYSQIFLIMFSRKLKLCSIIKIFYTVNWE